MRQFKTSRDYLISQYWNIGANNKVNISFIGTKNRDCIATKNVYHDGCQFSDEVVFNINKNTNDFYPYERIDLEYITKYDGEANEIISKERAEDIIKEKYLIPQKTDNGNYKVPYYFAFLGTAWDVKISDREFEICNMFEDSVRHAFNGSENKIRIFITRTQRTKAQVILYLIILLTILISIIVSTINIKKRVSKEKLVTHIVSTVALMWSTLTMRSLLRGSPQFGTNFDYLILLPFMVIGVVVIVISANEWLNSR